MPEVLKITHLITKYHKVEHKVTQRKKSKSTILSVFCNDLNIHQYLLLRRNFSGCSELNNEHPQL
jgi:hypothetical protein